MATRRPLVVISGRVQELPVGDSVESAPAGGGSIIAITATIDFGTVPVYSKLFEVIAPSAVTSSSFMVDAVPSSDASEMDGVLLTARCYVDGIVTVYAQAIPGPLTGLVNIRCVQILSTADLGSIAVQDSDAVAITGGSAQFTGVSSVNVNSASPALKITQAGTGNAFIVEDAASDTTPFVIDASGTVVSGHTSAIPIYGFNPQSQIISAGNAYQLSAAFRNDAFAPIYTLAHSRSASLGSHSVALSGDECGHVAFACSDGTQFIRTAQISSFVDGTPGTNDMPGRLVFSTTADGVSTPTARMRIDSAGNVLVTSAAGLGYGTGAGGTVTQADTPTVVKTNNVTLSKPSGRVITNAGPIAAGAAVSFYIANTLVTDKDTVVISFSGGGVGGQEVNYTVTGLCGTNLIYIGIRNHTGVSRSEVIHFNFAVIKGGTT